MTFRDLVVISTGNLWRMKLRTFLTTSGVLITIAAFVSMLSFGAGNQEHINNEFNKLGLFSTMPVYPKNRDNISDTASVAKLDQNAVKRFAAIPGVNIVYPYDAFSVTAKLGDSVFSAKAQAAPDSRSSDKAVLQFERGCSI
jgi:acetoin utilization transport system permease protein